MCSPAVCLRIAVCILLQWQEIQGLSSTSSEGLLGQKLWSPLGVGLSTTWTSHMSWVMQCTQNRGAKIPDYGVWDHIVQVCAPFFQGIESRYQYESRWCQWEEEYRHTHASGDHRSPFHSPMTGEPRSGTRGNPRPWNQVGPGVSPEGGRMWENGRAVVGSELCPKPHGVGLPMTHQAPRVRSYLHHLSHHEVKQQRNLSAQQMAFRDAMDLAPGPHLCPGRTRCRRRRNRKGIPLWKVTLTWVHLPTIGGW